MIGRRTVPNRQVPESSCSRSPLVLAAATGRHSSRQRTPECVMRSGDGGTRTLGRCVDYALATRCIRRSATSPKRLCRCTTNVGVDGFEPPVSSSRTRRIAKLSHTPKWALRVSVGAPNRNLTGDLLTTSEPLWPTELWGRCRPAGPRGVSGRT